ncbi:hypothetical protein JQN58_07495 [Aneurinibacillus sp. BA2021]|nr:hypothetical protein [Aneurinibacillus sp. BA2021]
MTIPPLREREEEIIPLAEYFTQVFNQKYGQHFFLSLQAKQQLQKYSWPGNIRELENLVERMVVTQSEEIAEQLMPQSEQINSSFHLSPKAELPPLKEAKKKVEKELILHAYNVFKNTYKVADALKVDQSTIVKKLKQYRDEENNTL